MTLIRYALTLALGFSSVGIASAQESSPMNINQDSAMTVLDRYNQMSHQIFATLTERAKLFEAKARLATQCAKGLRLIENVATLTAPNDDDEEAQWRHETFFLVRMWFTKEQQDEWYFAGNEVGDYLKSHIDEAHSKEEALEDLQASVCPDHECPSRRPGKDVPRSRCTNESHNRLPKPRLIPCAPP
jgi:hypothetical protein